MAGAEQLPSGRWRLIVHRGRDPLTGKKMYDRQVVDATGKRDAQRQADEWEVDLRRGEVTHKAGTFAQLTEQWIETRGRRWSPTTQRENPRIVDRYLTKSLGELDVSDIGTHTIDRLYGALLERGGKCRNRPCPRQPCKDHGPRCERKKCTRPPCKAHEGKCAGLVPCDRAPCPHGGPLTPATVQRIHTVVRSALEQAVKWGWIRRNPAEHAERGEVIEQEVDPPAAPDVVLLLAEAEAIDKRLAVYLLVAIEAGARRGAVHALRWSHLDLATGTARFPNVVVIGPKGTGVVERPATKSKRTARNPIAISPWLVAALVAHHDDMFERARAADGVLPSDALVFSDDPLGARPWRPDSTSRKFRTLRWAAGLDETRLHDLRHFMATVLLGNQIDPKVVAGRGGWSKVATMLDRYAHVIPANDRAAADVMGRALRPAEDQPSG
jgi:integrase